MRIGGSLLLIALGAILKFAVTAKVSGIDVGVVGVILMVIGVIGLVITAIWMSTRRRTDVIQHGNGTTYVTPRQPIDTI
jgi:membrane-bound ClpP family serine protease